MDGTLKIRISTREIEAQIRVIESRPSASEALDHLLQSGVPACVFLRDFPVSFVSGRPLPNFRSALGMDVPSRAQELWRLPALTGAELAEVVVHHIQLPRSPLGDAHPASKVFSARRVERFLAEHLS